MNPSLQTHRYKLIPLLLFVLTLTGCNLPGIPKPAQSPETSNPSAQAPETNAVIVFNVEIPANTPSGETILLSILDEVTGLALNPKRFTMTALDATHYYVGLPLPVGSIVKYRYSRQGEILAEEHISDGRPVRYRMVSVDAPGEVHDVVTRWNDTNYGGPKGRITGTVVDAATSHPVPGMLVTAGGSQVFTSGDGSFLIEGLPPGTHNLVIYALDGSYKTFQQGALVADASNTPAEIRLTPAQMVDITFIVTMPEDTPPVVPIRIAGNLYQLGNTFADLSGGVSTLASRMPVLSHLPDNTYGIILSLPAGADLQYKYTLGDGFWNTERAERGDFVVRQMIVPNESAVIRDTVETWQVGNTAPITFDITVPETTPADEEIFIQLNPYGWTEPLPMWHLGGQRWAYILYSPLDMLDRLGYRYCRAGQCGHADDARTPGVFTSGQIVETAENPQGVPDQISEWIWLYADIANPVDLTTISAELREPDFLGGIEIQERYHPSWGPLLPSTFEKISALSANTVVLTPSWTFTRSDPPVLEPVAGQDALWQETATAIRQAKAQKLNVVLRPVAHFPTAVNEWWRAAPRDFSWWVSWFSRYQAFAIHHADLAEKYDVPILVLGGDWMSPAMPFAELSGDGPSGVPPDADQRYRALIQEVRSHYNGKIAWAVSYPQDILNPPGFLADVDMLYVLWSAPLSEDSAANEIQMQAEAERILTTEVYTTWLAWELQSGQKDILIDLIYPSVEGTATNCIADPIQECIPPASLNFPAPDYPLLDLDFAAQARAYQAVLAAINQQKWVSGVVSGGYYPPAILQDKSTSIHGKPAEEVLRTWFEQFLVQQP